jgi:hypothetical protein
VCLLQVPRILNPVVLVLDSLPKLCRDAQLHAYVTSVFSSVEGCRKAILLDFFRHAFDGSGADNFVSRPPVLALRLSYSTGRIHGISLKINNNNSYMRSCLHTDKVHFKGCHKVLSPLLDLRGPSKAQTQLRAWCSLFMADQ